MRIHQLTVGPIVGETTASRARIWGRGDTTVIHGRPRRCFGALRHRKAGTATWSRTAIVKMNPNFDMTGIVVVDGLSATTAYEFQFGYFYSDAELRDAGFRESAWESDEDGSPSEYSTGTFVTASNNDKAPRNLVIGSCRYLLKTFLGDFYDDRGDKTFRSILKQIKDGDPVHQLLMMGDQIYADDMNFLNPDRSVDKFYRRYRDAFGQPHIRRLMSQVPTYMMLDDHEIEDNWPEKASSLDWRTLFPVAIHAYQSYQLGHSPAIPIRRGRLSGTLDHLWYRYTDGCCDVFVLDCRTERTLDPNLMEMISHRQLRTLLNWLEDGAGRVKIIVTSVPFFPDSASSEGADKWAGFTEQRNRILAHIEKKGVGKVVFCSGDVHASIAVELQAPSGNKLLSVVSSAFFWPYPHPSARHFRLTGTLDAGAAGKYKLANASKVVADDNFTRLAVSPEAVRVQVFSRKNRKLSDKTYKFS